MNFFGRCLRLLFTIIVVVQVANAQTQRNSEEIACVGDSCAQKLNYRQAKKYYFEALTIANEHPTAHNRQLRKDLTARIGLMDRHLHFVSVLQNAKMLEDVDDLSSAKIFYADALRYAKKENLKNEPLDSLKNRMMVLEKVMDVYAFLQDAKAYEAVEDYKMARKSFCQAYATSQKLRPQVDEYEFSPIVVARLDSLSRFMRERQSMIYDYKNIFSADYDTIRMSIQKTLSNSVAVARNLTATKIIFTSRIDTLGRMYNEYSSSTQDSSLLRLCNSIAQKLQFKQFYQNGMTIAAQDTFSYVINRKEWETRIVKNSKGIKMDTSLVTPFLERLNSFLCDAPKGKFTFMLNRIYINADEYDKVRLVKVRGMKAKKWICENSQAVRCRDKDCQENYILNI